MHSGRGSNKYTRKKWPKWLNNAFCQKLGQLIAFSIRYLWCTSCSVLPRRASRFLKAHFPALAVPKQHSWRSVMGDPIPQTRDSTCSVCAVTVGIEGVHRMEYEWINGPGTFLVRASYTRKLVRRCMKTGSLSYDDGSYVDDILDQVMKQGGVPTTSNPKMYFLAIRRYKTITWSWLASTNLPEYTFAQLLFTRGPCIGVLWVNDYYFSMVDKDADEDDEQVFRGVSKLNKAMPGKNTGCHAVAVYAYKFVRRGLRLRVLDNQDENGPRRWVLFKAFDKFFFLSVDPLPHSPEALRPLR
uniref:Uncharacterized protein n=1 Tax=Avena sativa TaxID=4498 RepID=A0ACD6AIF6_AVESA